MTILLAFDAETTGVNYKEDRAVQWAAVAQQEGVQSVVINCLCDPGMPIPDEASQIHRVYDKDVQGMASHEWAAFTVINLFRSIAEHDELILVGQNQEVFDTPLLEHVTGDKVEFPQIDILRLTNWLYPELPEKKLTFVHKELLGVDLDDAHDAGADCRGCLDVLNFILEDKDMSIAEVVEGLRVPRPYKIFPFGRHRGTPAEKVPSSYYRWMRQNFDDIEMKVDLMATIERYS